MNLILDLEWFRENMTYICPILNIRLEFKNRLEENSWNCPSIDRIDNSKGYTKDNCIIISKRANMIKNMSTIHELVEISNFYQKLIKNRNKDDIEYYI